MSDNMVVAFDILLEEIENTIDELSQEGALAFQNKNLVTAHQLAEKASKLLSLGKK